MAKRKRPTKRKKPTKRVGPERKSKQKSKPRRARRTGRPPAGTVDWTIPFLAAIYDGLHVRDAAEEAKVGGSMPYRRREEDAAFGEAWAQASKIGTKALEAEANRRAFHGTLKPVYHGGDLVGYIREYSDSLIMFLLRGRKPGKYRDKKVEHSGADGKPIQVQVIEIVRPESKEAGLARKFF